MYMTGIDITEVSDEAKQPLGLVVGRVDPSNPDRGVQEWIYVYNDEPSTDFVIGTIVARDAATAEYHCIIAALGTPTIRVVGVAQHTIGEDQYGFVLRKGIGEVLADTGGITANTALVVGDAVAGRADDVAAVTTHAFGFSTEAATATNLATCFVNCPG